MKQLLVLALVAFLAAVAGGTWFSTSLWPDRTTASDSVRAAVTAAVPPAPAPAPAAARVEVDTAGQDSTSAPAVTPAAITQQPAPSPETLAREKTVAKVIAAMKPKDAAGLIANLSDDEVERIVRQLNAKQVAALLTALPQERAARLSRRLLEPRNGNSGGSE